MWSSVAVLALPIALDPVRLGVNLLLISRPRPAQNLLVYWVGCVLASLLLLLVPILALHYTPALSSFVHEMASPGTKASSALRHTEVVLGALVVSIAVLLGVRFLVRQRVSAPSGDADSSNPIARLLRRNGDDGSAGRGPLARARNAWEGGALWVALLIGFWAGPNPSLVIFALATILASGAAIGTQVGAAVVFIVETLAIVEIVLVCHAISPVKTEAFLRRLHDWARTYRQQILVVMLALVGLALVAQGMGVL
jgi:Sap, sulfolipid-1-addressing protein